MRFLAAILALLVTGCPHVVVKDSKGVTRFRSSSNARFITYQDENTKLTIEGLDNGTPIRETGKALNNVTGSVGSIITAGGAGALIPLR